MKAITIKVALLASVLALVSCGGDDDKGKSDNNSSSSSSSSSASSSSSSNSSSSSSSSSTSSGGEQPRYIKLFEDNFESGTVSKWSAISLSGSNDWVVESYAGDKFAVGNCYQSDGDCDDWLISPALDLSQFESAKITFNTAWNYGVDALSQLTLKVSSDFTGDPAVASWTDISDRVTWSAGNFVFTDSGEVSLSDFVGQPIVVAFHYAHPAADSTKWEVDDILIDGMGTGDFPLDAEVVLPDETFYVGRTINMSASAFNGAGEPYSFAWDFGDGDTASGSDVAHSFATPGEFTVSLTVTDSASESFSTTKYISVQNQTTYSVPAEQGDFRVATYNAGFDPFSTAGELKTAFDTGVYVKAKKVAEVIQRANPDVLLLNEIDGNDTEATINAFNAHYLQVSQNGAQPVVYDYIYTNNCNTGVPSGFDFNNDGVSDGPDDAYGFGDYPGKYCLAIFSKYPLDSNNARSFQNFLWKDMPGALKPQLDGSDYYSSDEWDVFRLSSKTHIDVPVIIGGKTIHLLGSHPTPPVFDGAEDRNGKRNSDEIRLWADYIDPTAGTYLYDDNGNTAVTLNEGDMFIILGDENASSVEGDAYIFDDDSTAIDQLLQHPLVNPNLRENSVNFQVPTSVAGAENDPDNVYASTHTAGWMMRADYVLPSASGMRIKQAGVFWPRHSDNLHYLVESLNAEDVESSDHRLVWMDLEFFDGTVDEPQEPSNKKIITEDDFTSETLEGWTLVDTGASSQNWQHSSFGEDHFARISCYSAAESCDDWLVRSVDLSNADNPVLSFRSAYNYGTDPESQISLLITTAYTGDVTTTTWTDLSSQINWSTGSWAFIESGEIDLSAYSGGDVTIAFRYQSSNGGDAATWEIASFLVEGDLAPYASDDFTAGLGDWSLVDAGEPDNGWEGSDFSGTYFARISCYSGDENCDDWLVRSVDLSYATQPILSFDSAYNYGTDPLNQISLLVSSDFSGDVNTATWTDLSSSVVWSTGSWAFVSSGAIDLSSYVGDNITIAFRYNAPSGGDAATWEIANFLIEEYSEPEEDPKGGTIVGNIAPGDDLNTINQRGTGVLVFSGINAPANAEEETSILASSAATLDGVAIPGFGYKTLAKSGQLVDGNIYAQVKDKFGTPLFISNYNEFTSILTRGERIFAISQFENIPGGMALSELAQDDTTGELSMIATRGIDFSDVNGGYNHCAAMVTPWDTHLGSEEYEPDYGARSEATGQIDVYYDQIEDYHAGLSLLDINPYWYGFAVEVDVNVSESDYVSDTVTKHYAMGRLAIELAYVMPDMKTVYLTDDGTNGGLFMFIADVPADLSTGTLYAMKWTQTASASAENAGMAAADISWIEMGHATNEQIGELINGANPLSFEDIFERTAPAGSQCMLGYHSINFKGNQECLILQPGMELAASRLETRRYAAYLGATVEMRKEEGITYNPHNHKMYLAISDIDNGMLTANSADTGGPDHLQISTRNDCGGLYEMSLGSNSMIGSEYVIGEMVGLISGEVVDGSCALDNIAGPDNVAYIGFDTLIITEDTDDHDNNFVWAYDLNAETLTRIFSAPSGAENTGPYMFNNINGFSYISNVVQHPAGESVDPSPGNEAEVGYFGPIPVE
ncbi:endonuclease/exonuclease/phosphatase family protein [Alteromonadaceae bacterium 2753L.S.0a.02]|nr:endonuclease/exonuclease/phosphatase family protein [Alteromonadaceae bacterium 2753L.S.0a.02]